jgi:hypothetical protein
LEAVRHISKEILQVAAGSNAGMLGRADVPEIVTNGKVLRWMPSGGECDKLKVHRGVKP